MLALAVGCLQFALGQLELRSAAIKVGIVVLVVPNQSVNASGVDGQRLNAPTAVGEFGSVMYLLGICLVR